MKTPELSLLHSETIATQLAFDRLALAPNGEDLAALTDRLGLKTPNTLTAALVYPGDQVLFSDTEDIDDPAKADAPSAGMQDLSVFPEGTLAVSITELSERNILEGFARSLMVRGQFNKQMRVLKWGAAALMTELGVGTMGSTLQGPGFNWWLLSIPAAALTGGGVWLRYRNLPKGRPILPSLDGLKSPIRITEQRTQS